MIGEMIGRIPISSALQVGGGTDSAGWGELGRANDQAEFGASIATGREQPSK